MALTDLTEKSEDVRYNDDYWATVDDMLENRVISSGKKYLPVLPKEPTHRYAFRLANAKFTNIFSDIVQSLAAKPFAEELNISDDASDEFKWFAENVDGLGNNMHVFLHSTFLRGIAFVVDFIWVDYIGSSVGMTRAQQLTNGARPVWKSIPATALIDIRSDIIAGKEEITYIKFYLDESSILEIAKAQIENSETDRPSVVIAKTHKKIDGEWALQDETQLTTSIITVVPYITGTRKGSSWKINAPFRAVTDLQLCLYREETGLAYAKAMTAYPLLQASGVQPERDPAGNIKPLELGPGSALFAPPSANGTPGSWSYIEPQATSLSFLSGEIDKTKRELRELGKLPLTSESGNLTVVTTMFAASKGNSAVQQWALGLKDAAELALQYTALYYNTDESPEISIYTDFGVSDSDNVAIDALLKMREPVENERDISRETLWKELKRRRVLSSDFDSEKEIDRLQDEVMPFSDDPLDVGLDNPNPAAI